MFINKQGSTRVVFVFKKIVIKIPSFVEYKLFLYGLLANVQEYTFSKMNRRDLGKVYFVSRFGLINIMKKYKVLDWNDWEYRKQEIVRIYEKDDMKEFMLSDLKPQNWGIDEYGEYVKIDFGN